MQPRENGASSVLHLPAMPCSLVERRGPGTDYHLSLPPRAREREGRRDARERREGETRGTPAGPCSCADALRTSMTSHGPFRPHARWSTPLPPPAASSCSVFFVFCCHLSFFLSSSSCSPPSRSSCTRQHQCIAHACASSISIFIRVLLFSYLTSRVTQH